MTAAAPTSTAELDLIARRLRFKVIEMSHAAGTPHLGSALSCLDILVAAYWNIVRVDVQQPTDPLRDRFILSKGHAASALYATLAERGKNYGTFLENATVTQNIKRAMATGRNWETLRADQREALEMVAAKCGRILNGDPNHHDSWHDMAGYSKLVADTLNGESQ